MSFPLRYRKAAAGVRSTVQGIDTDTAKPNYPPVELVAQAFNHDPLTKQTVLPGIILRYLYFVKKLNLLDLAFSPSVYSPLHLEQRQCRILKRN